MVQAIKHVRDCWILQSLSRLYCFTVFYCEDDFPISTWNQTYVFVLFYLNYFHFHFPPLLSMSSFPNHILRKITARDESVSLKPPSPSLYWCFLLLLSYSLHYGYCSNTSLKLFIPRSHFSLLFSLTSYEILKPIWKTLFPQICNTIVAFFFQLL